MSDLFRERSGVRIDLGCGANKQGADWIGVDVRELPGVDIVHDLNMFPWPVPNEVATHVHASHLVEHIPPAPPDPRISRLVQLLIDKEVIQETEADEYFGDWRSTTPRFIRFMDEVWRVLKAGGHFTMALPHGFSAGFLQDPSHCNALNEVTWAYFDPLDGPSNGVLYRIYKPKPWEFRREHFYAHPAFNMEVHLIKRLEDSSYYE